MHFLEEAYEEEEELPAAFLFPMLQFLAPGSEFEARAR